MQIDLDKNLIPKGEMVADGSRESFTTGITVTHYRQGTTRVDLKDLLFGGQDSGVFYSQPGKMSKRQM